MRISRPCYDKPHRCPGRAGGGMNYAQNEKCKGGMIEFKYGVGRCNECDVIVLPKWIQYVDPTPSNVKWLISKFRYWLKGKM